MRKHFLILMLMALLPMAGWALDFGTVQIGSYTYGTAAFPEPLVKDDQNSILTKGTHYTVSTVAYKEAACTTEVAKQNLEGDKSYYLKITGIGAMEGKSTSVQFEVSKKELTVNVTKDFQREYQSTTEPTIATGDWSVTGLVTEAPWSDTKAELGTLTYTYAGKGNKDYPGGVYPITFSGLSSKYYDIKYPTNIKFTIVGTDLSGADITVKAGTNFADKTYKGFTYTAADLTGLKLVYGTKELVQGTDFDVTLDVIYNFSSFSAATGGTPYSTGGTVCVLSQDGTNAIVEVLTNPGYTDWVGKKFKVALTANNSTRVQLYGDGTGNDYTTASGVWVTVSPTTTLAKNVGSYNYGIKFKNNYSGSKTAGWITAAKFNVVAAPIVVSMNDIKKTYNGTNWKDHNFGTVLYTLAEYNTANSSSLTQEQFDALSFAQKVKTAAEATFIYSGLVGDDLADAATIAAVKGGFTPPTSVVITTDAKDVKDGGYNLTISGATAGTSTNYTIAEYIPGKLIIEQAELKLKAKDASKGIGAADPEFELDATANLVTGHEIKGVTFSRENGETAGTFAITPDYSAAKVYSNFGQASQKDETGNYKFAVNATKGKLTIGKSTIYVTIKDDEKFYGEADPEFDYIVTGLIGEDELGDFTISRAEGENAGSYALTAEVANPNTDKYEKVVVASGIFTIKKALLTFVLEPQNVVTGNKKDKLSTAKVKVTGIKNGDAATSLYELNFNGVSLTTDDKITDETKTYTTGYKATLKTAAQANYLIVINPTTTATEITGKLIVNGGDPGAALNLATAASVANNIVAKEGETVATVTMPNQVLNAKEWYAVVLPFATTPAELVQKLGVYVVVDKIKNSSMDAAGVVTVNFEMEWDKIDAGEPFLIKPAAQKNWNATLSPFTGKVVVKNITAKETTNATFTGTYANDQSLLWGKDLDGTTDKAGAAYRWLAHKEYKNDNNWKNPKTNAHALTPLEAFLILDPDAQKARIFVEDFENGTTAIKELGVDGTNKAYSVDGWYTLNGVKLQGAPTEKGVYINNGKKVVIK